MQHTLHILVYGGVFFMLFKPVFMRKMSDRMKYKSYKKKRKVNFLLLIIFYISFILLASTFFEQKILPTFITLAESKAQYIATKMVDRVIAEYITDNNVTYDQFFTLEKNSEGQVTALISNTSNMNKMKSQMTLVIQDRLNDVEDSNIKIPLLSFSGNLFLSDMGPKIPLRLMTTGYINMDIKNQFTAAGVNQTKHEVYIQCHSEITMLLPGRRAKAEINSVVPLTEAIIVGVVPNTYVNLDGTPLNQIIKQSQ